ncbi:MAG: hypothetical protein AVO33_08565 [delta proteobacterium ML8_F1]|nr:MAG: hypothetical protein AVO33_08565 [delta proteobacterium ML8_F1]
MSNNLLDNDTSSRLSILLILDLYGVPIQKETLVDFIHHKKIIQTETLYTLLEDLEASQMLSQMDGSYALTETGRVSLAFFKDRIPLDLQYTLEDLVGRIKPKPGQTVMTSLTPKASGDYGVNLTLLENEQSLLEITLTVPTRLHGEAITRRWKEHAEYLYGDIINLLTK